ncbi:MAG TPA: carcinine hydrolase/isopenicillin-N N-acyltransferase family protein [Deltaproteobacteria bacterium]|nr:carcinine hydrolase/isopenicillin-N N-acyltransferase family protein [Deltaproteobacteria bacterium]
MHPFRTVIFTTAWLLLGVYGCSSSGGGGPDRTSTDVRSSSGGADGSSAGTESLYLEDVLSSQGLTIVKTATCRDPMSGEEYTGYLARFGQQFTEGTNAAGEHVGPLPKECLVLRGSSYCMGYQMGALKPAETWRMVNEYIFTVPEEMLGIKRSYFPLLFDFLESAVRTLCEGARGSIPDYLEAEMEGVAAGARAQGYAVSAENVMLLNEGFDAIYSILFTGVLPGMQALTELLDPYKAKLTGENKTSELEQLENSIQIEEGKVCFPLADPFVMGCNEFVVSGNATPEGAVYHGRDFMFSTGDMYQDYACLAVYLPEEGHPFVAVTAPGFVGHPTLLNSQGLSMGVDVVLGACTRPTPGLGALMVLRDIVQHCATLDEAVARMKNQDRGVSWLYIIADDQASVHYTHGVVIEEGRSTPDFSGPDVMPGLNEWLFDPWIDKLEPEPLPERGLMFRNQAWEYPAGFEDASLGYPGTLSYLLYFPEQAESWSDVVLATNHYIIPRMVFTSFTPLMAINGAGTELDSSIQRYWLLRDRIAQEHGSITFDKAVELIDFLNPNRGLDTRRRYAIGGPVCGHHAAIDNTNRVVAALFGYYGDWDHGVGDTWVRLDMRPFAQYLRQQRGNR